MYAYRLAGDDPELAEAELRGFLRSKGVEEEIDRNGELAFTEAEPDFLKRLALAHEVAQIVGRGEELDTDYRPKGSFAVRSEGMEADVEQRLGSLMETSENSVDLEDPDEIVKVYRNDDEYIIGRLVQDIDRGLFEQRKNQDRPFSSPVSLDPVLARVLVNLSEVSAGEKLLDPFCGTGGILIEAGLCGVDVYGMDIQQEMVEGTRENLEEYGLINHHIRQGSIANLDSVFAEKFDAVVADLPYGQASKSEGEPVEEFLEKVEGIADKAVFMYDEPDLNGLDPEFEVYVHKNLTRYIYILSQSQM